MKTFIIPLMIAIISGMGLGGGGLLVIYLTLFEGTDQIIAQWANLSFFIITALASTVMNARAKRIRWRTTLLLSAAGIAASLLGTIAASALDSALLGRIFGSMLVIGGAISLFSGKSSSHS